MNARELLYGLPVSNIVAACSVSIHTARRWKRSGRVPAPVARLLELITTGDLGALDPNWRGFRIAQKKLFTPSGFPVAPGEICAIPYRAAQLRALERELREPQQRELLLAHCDCRRCA